MPIRVPEGPIDPYEPFPFDGVAAPSWSRAPIIRGRDASGLDGRDVVANAAAADEARFVDIEVAAPAPPPLHEWRFADDVLRGASPAAGIDGADVRHGNWLLDGVAGPESPIYAPPDLPPSDPWAVVTAAAAGDGAFSEPIAPPAPPAPAPEAPAADDIVLRPGGPPMSSRAILMVGSLALLCLALAAALAFQAIDSADEAPPALDAPAAEAAAAPAPRAREVRFANPLLESLPVSDTTLTAIERAAMGPLEIELERLGRALQAAFGRSSSEVAPVLRPYIAHAAERVRSQPVRFRLVVNAPRAELAAARADAIRLAFEGAGLPADMLTMTAGAGAPSVSFER